MYRIGALGAVYDISCFREFKGTKRFFRQLGRAIIGEWELSRSVRSVTGTSV